MSEHKTREELHGLSQPALQHAELINIARTETPNGAYELASSRWPRRQAKAVRFLAMVRRDYGIGAFEALVSQVEHARANSFEHAQGGSLMTLDTMYPQGVRNVVFAPVHDTPTLELLAIRHISGGECKDINLKDEVERLGLNEEQTKLLVRRIVEAMLEQWANSKAKQFFYGHMWGTALFAVRTFLSADETLHRRVLLAFIVYCGGHTKHTVGFTRDLMPTSVKRSDEKFEDYTLQESIDYMLSVGCTENEVCVAWVEMIQTRYRDNFLTACILEWYNGLKVGDKRLDQEPGIVDVARQRLLYELKDVLVNGWGEKNPTKGIEARLRKEFFTDVIDVLISDAGFDWMRSDETRELVEELFISCLARGATGTAHFILGQYGDCFGLWSEYRKGSFDGAMNKLIRGAMVKAEESSLYGIATALAEHLGEVTDADRLREKSRALGQKIALQFGY